MNRAERVLRFLEQYPNTWIQATAFEPIGGRQAWRTAISEARQLARLKGWDIENRVRVRYLPSTNGLQNGPVVKISEYRYIPASLLEQVS